MSISGAAVIPYRRLTDPISLPYGLTSQRTAVPAGYIPTEATSFRVTNRGSSWVRLKGAQGANAATLTIADGEGWLFPPGFSGTFTTQFPEAMATIAVGAGAAAGVLEISYGVGGGGESASSLSASGGQTDALTNTQLRASAVPVSVGNFPAIQTTQARGTGSMATGQVNMVAGNTAYQVAPARTARRSITIVPASQFTYFYGNSGVTTATGAAAPNGVAITLETTAAVFVVSGSTGVMTFVEHF